MKERSVERARMVFLVSIVYLPVLCTVMVIDRIFIIYKGKLMENSEANEMAVKLFRVVFIGAALFMLAVILFVL